MKPHHKVLDASGEYIVVNYDYPPIPIRTMDYSAHFEDYEPGRPVGHGPTPDAAIEDLKMEVEAFS